MTVTKIAVLIPKILDQGSTISMVGLKYNYEQDTYTHSQFPLRPLKITICTRIDEYDYEPPDVIVYLQGAELKPDYLPNRLIYTEHVNWYELVDRCLVMMYGEHAVSNYYCITCSSNIRICHTCDQSDAHLEELVRRHAMVPIDCCSQCRTEFSWRGQ